MEKKALVLPIETKIKWIEGKYGFMDEIWEISANFIVDNKLTNFTRRYKREYYGKVKAEADFIRSLREQGLYNYLRETAKATQAK